MAIIVGLSRTALGELAIERAVDEAILRDLPVVLTSSVSMPRNEQDATRFRTRHDEAETALQRRARQLADRGIVCRTYLPASPTSASEAILTAADEHDAALIVVGIRRRSPVGKLVLGSTTQDVLLAAHCPVLGVKLAEEDEDER